MKKTLLTLLAIILTITIGANIANAIGSLTPVGVAGDDTQYSLNDIYDKLSNFNDTPTATSSPFVVPGTLSSTFHTLTEIYDLLNSENSDLVPGKIATGTTIFGVKGTYEQGTILRTDWSVATSTATMSYDDAVIFCNDLIEDGTNWSLPTSFELHNGGINEVFPNIGYNFWSITARISDSDYVYTSDNEGQLSGWPKTNTDTMKVICIR